jgi:uncharacterized protein (TIGR03382 family)
MGQTRNIRRFALVCVAMLLMFLSLAPAQASAAIVGSVAAINIQVESGEQIGSWSTSLEYSGDTFEWQLGSPLTIYDDNEQPLATITSLSMAGDKDPFVTLGFAVSAGAAPTAFTITSATIGFAPIVGGLAFASAAVTLTDGSPLIDGASMVGAFPGAHNYQAQYNGMTGVFADLVPSLFAPPGGVSFSGVDRVPLVGRIPIPGAVVDIESQFKFTLSPFDLASGTSRFDIVVPEPSSIMLALVGAVGLAWQVRRRRSR